MADLSFSTEELLEQARGNQTAIWHLAVRWARTAGASVDEWASFVGEEFAPSWDELGDDASALEVGRLAGLNIATTADMHPVELTGDDARAELVVEGPDQAWTDSMGTTIEELDRTTELIFRAIAERRGLSLTVLREGNRFRLVFEKNPSVIDAM